MSQFGKRPRHVIAKDHVPNIRASLIDDVTDCWTVARVDESMEAMSVSFPETNALYANDRTKRIMGGDTKSIRRAWTVRRVLQTRETEMRGYISKQKCQVNFRTDKLHTSISSNDFFPKIPTFWTVSGVLKQSEDVREPQQEKTAFLL